MREGVGERHDRLLNLVRERGSVRVADLAGLLGVSAVTARRDAEALASRGLLDRVHGAVSWPERNGPAGTGPGAGSPVLGMLAPAAGYYFADIIRGAHEAAARLGARLVLRVSDYRPEDDAAHAAGLLAAGARGLLVIPSWTRPEHQSLYTEWIARLPVPAVLVERRGDPAGPLDALDRVGSDHAHGVLVGLRHLARLGHRSPVLVARTDSPTAQAVRAGYRRAVEILGLEAGLPVLDSAPEKPGAGSPAASVDALAALVREGRTTAVLAHNDEDATRLVRDLAERGVRVPGDLALVTYDDEVAALAEIPLTAVAPPKRAVGRAAVELLTERLAEGGGGEGEPRRHVELLPALRVRGSCGAVG
ncbi:MULTISPECIES: LacI family DNA-binding transcriptional regulator [Streptomyces]|uniref:Substrate-binding domain-containing protein n=2 Tax=Streptomyces TaxID=1883 RepID=A0ABU2QXI0_9ACTN|nr:MULTISPECIES: substrate-binding domain-containing protein [unclassified Streptomyces]MDT0409153.1 substrate-binding domain-containing protein [Streptomyces sp. DSM 41979]MYQ58531.1 substrate-binding domain-containing protein [Streptomyces sp. SID4926]NJA57978.1 DeoR/GlpR family transcriptional regulator [Streptomyces sp. NEAU-H3]SCD84296.1 DNA-binding transcriptional regulator, LacI/PurR family [Streptomyces sp. DfronAA-171]